MTASRKLSDFILFDSVTIEVPLMGTILIWNADESDHVDKHTRARHEQAHCVYILSTVQDLVDLAAMCRKIDGHQPHKALEILSALGRHLPTELLDIINSKNTK